MTTEESAISMAECGACRAIIPVDSTSCPKCGISFVGVSDEALGACGACDGLAPLDSTSCPHCGVSFIADDVVEVLSKWLGATGLAVSSLFSRFDANDDGEISSEELRDGLLALNLADLPPSQIEKLISLLDEDGNGTIDLGELERIIVGESSAVKESSEEEGAADDSEKDDSDDDSGKDDSDEDSGKDDSDEDSGEDDSDDDSDEGESEDSGDDSDKDDSDDDSDKDGSDEGESDDSDDDSDKDGSDEGESDDSGDDSDKDGSDEGESDDSGDDSDKGESEGSDDDSEKDDSDEGESAGSDDDSDKDDSDEGESDGSEDDSDSTNYFWGEVELSNLQVLGIAIAKSDMSIKEVFKAMDTNNDGRINGPELQKGIIEICGENLSPDEVYEMLKQFDEDDDGSLDPMELIEAIESLDMDIVSDKKATKKKVKPKKPFPTDLQKAMMGKKWNDIFWPLIHFALFAMAAIWIANGLGAFVDGTGGSIAYDGAGAYTDEVGLNEGEWVEKGDIYYCESDIQNSKCKNSLTPLAGDDGSSSMPVGFYWDGILMILLFFAGMGGSIYAHLVLMKNWRAEAKKLKDESGDSEDDEEGNASDSDDEDDDSDDDEDDDSDEDEDDDSDDDEDDDSDENEDDDSDEEGDIDIGSRIGVEVDGKEYFGEIIEFNDEEETVVIEDEDSGDEITAMQEDMFVE
ncbi:MAG TPA: hypothetical protein EYQ53_06410 [Candidatus Poseidoniales archaeon]|nr:hypothetical protein [Candidatus Poseidoniales archaeon]